MPLIEVHPYPEIAEVETRRALGFIDTPLNDPIVASAIRIEGWALHSEGVRAVEVRVDGTVHRASYGFPRPDVARAWPAYPDAAAAGFIFACDFARSVPAHHELVVVVISRGGRESVLGTRNVLPPAALEQWKALYLQRGAEVIAPFYLAPALSGIVVAGAAGLERAYAG